MPRQRKMPSGMCKRGDAYYARFRAGGRLVRKRLSSDYSAAVTLLNELRARADKADFGLLDNDCPWSELKAEFLKWAKQAIRRPHEYEADLRRIESFTTIRSVRQVTPALVMGYREWRLSQSVVVRTRGEKAAPLSRKVSPRTVNREVGTLSNMLNKGVEWKRIGSNPIAGLKPLRHDAPVKQRRPLSADEVARLFEASPAYLKPVWRMFLCTGVRMMELADLRFSDIDFDARSLTIRANIAKSKKAREIPLDDATLATLAELRDAAPSRRPMPGKTPAETESQRARFSKAHVFVTTVNTPFHNGLLKLFYACCKRAGIDDAHSGGSVDLHAMRGSFATLAMENGASPKAVQEILGHSTLAMTMSVYAKATERAKRDAIGSLPFATVSTPEHVVSVQIGPKVCASVKVESQVKAHKALA